MKTISINPITRLEGHGKIDVFIKDDGTVDRAYLRIPELRGFEKFCEGRPVEEMPRITPRICGVCPTAHHMASAKAVDDLFGVEPPPAAKKIRELIYSAFMVEDHLLHFFFLGGPDFIIGPDADPTQRNILGVAAKVGLEIAGKLIDIRKQCRRIITELSGKVIHPVSCVPGGVSKGVTPEMQKDFQAIGAQAVEFTQFALQAFNDIVLKNEAYVSLITGDVYKHDTYYMGLLDANDKVNFYDGDIGVAAPDGSPFARFKARDYASHIAEHVEPWTYVKFPYLNKVGWNGFTDGPDSGIYAVAPLARLNASKGMATPLAQQAHDQMYETLGGKPSGLTLAFHWARLIEALYAAERLAELAADPEITSSDIRNIPTSIKGEGWGVVEAPRGTLLHHYQSDEKGLITRANLIVATQNNQGRINLSVDKAAKALIKNGEADQGVLNMLEMAFRAYDPCMACATHSLPGQMPLQVRLLNTIGEVIHTVDNLS